MDVKEKISIIHNLMSVNKFTQAIIDCHKLIKLTPKCFLSLQSLWNGLSRQ
jgi:hypothetical protein